ncbi:MAG: tRNA (adenosine(37)-N6)-threonylcarbamoyltransferase complex ATPase subunit type 1 TsaE, partial [Rhodobacteraceae bacterium]|nr:tRNA (adenosine(37)-N6)-threonylcarbamoyltransferase complex ATPase subunit type 1 TsaE [Paracoccaceae bacterium]
MKTNVTSVEQMQQLGKQIGSRLKTGDVVVLTGELAAGKTVLTQG